MFPPKSCRSQHIRFLQRFLRIFCTLALTIASISFSVGTFAEEANTESASSDSQTKSAVINDSSRASVNAAGQSSGTPAKKNAGAANDSDKNAESPNSESDEDNTPDAAEILNKIRKSYAEKMGIDNLDDVLILSQSSAYIFLSRKKIRDVGNNILDHWYVSSFEDDFNLTSIVFEAISVNPLTINLDPDIVSRLLLKNKDNPLLIYFDTSQTYNAFINFPIPESVMEQLQENDEDIVDKKPSRLIPETLSSYNYVVLFLAILGLSILGYVIYRLVVWAFLLDQNPDYDLQKGRDEDVVAPVNMDAFTAYIYQTPPKDKQ